MAEWLYDAGIGETRAALVADGRIVEAHIERDSDGPRLGAVMTARLVEPGKALLDAPGERVATLAGAAGLPLGARLTVEITRMALRERGRDKPARARIADAAPTDGPDLRARIAATGLPVVDLSPHGPDRLEDAGWSELVDHVRAGHWPFAGGALWVDTTPAMTLIDIDGEGDALALALAKAGGEAAVRVIRCCGIGGSIGIDFPSLPDRAARQAIDALVDALLPPPFERTAINGFGLMQIIRRRDRPSLIEQIRFDAAATDAAMLLRQAGRAVGTGALQLTARAAVADHIAARPHWTAALQDRTGRPVRIVVDAQAKGAGHAQ